MIELIHLEKKYENATPLKDVNATINDGDVISIIGPSGTGKSTLIRCINMLERPTSGQIIVDGEDITAKDYDVTKARRKMGMVFQSFNLFPHLTIIENIMKPQMELLKRDKQEAYDKAKSLLSSVGLLDKMLNYPDELSGGQKQRIAIARAILRKSPIIILDEATASVDVETERKIQQAVGEITGKRTILAVAHRLSTIRKADKIIVIREGKIIESGTHEELVSLGGVYAEMNRIQNNE